MPYEMSTVKTVSRRSRGKASTHFSHTMATRPPWRIDLSVDLSGGSQRVMLGGHRTDAHARVKCYKSLRTVR